ncbi:M20 family metallopeptidase [Miltoncostaea marina]|uniref:M20 family metallopeptidase n=1 Tax=Miltoncostaea marina TaxID=2843215 RepID=UPI001C3E1757|nr:M20/M25/M40 family metallo-hydrolase [Miltoncostaea marina]
MDEVLLAERLIAYDTSRRSGIGQATDFVAGWLEARGASVERRENGGRRSLAARVGAGPLRLIFHAHIDVVPGHPEQFVPRVEGGRLYGRGAYDMKAALGAMMLAVADLASEPLDGALVELVVVPDEERSEPGENCTQMMVRDGLRADFVVCGEPTDMDVGVQAKGVLMLRVDVPGTAAHGATPWLGDNAVLRAVDLFRGIGDLPFAAESAPLFERPSLNLGLIQGGDAVNKVPDHCRMHVDVRYLPTQSPDEVLAQVRSLDPLADVQVVLERPPADVSPDHPLVRALLGAAGRHEPSAASVGRDGASDAVAFIEVGVPAVEFGPRGAGHHGPEEYVEIASLPRYRRALVEFARSVAAMPAPAPRDEAAL